MVKNLQILVFLSSHCIWLRFHRIAKTWSVRKMSNLRNGDIHIKEGMKDPWDISKEDIEIGNISWGTCPPPYVSKITISLSPTLRMGPGMNRVFWGPAWWYLFAKGKVTGLHNLNLQGFRFIAFALPSNVEAIYHHKSMGPVPDKWLLRVIKRSASATQHKCTVEKIRSLIFQTFDSSEKCLSWL